jgi:hypothetical protein
MFILEFVHILNMNIFLLVGVNTKCSFGDVFIFNINHSSS